MNAIARNIKKRSKVKYFLDTEFIEAGRKNPLQLISIGIVCEDGREGYSVSNEFDETLASDWVKENVISKLNPMIPRQPVWMIAKEVEQFILEGSGKPEFWAYYADYDWVVFCQMFGTMMDLPKGFPMYCRDIKQLCDDLGNPRLPKQESGEHNALEDARWNKQAYDYLTANLDIKHGKTCNKKPHTLTGYLHDAEDDSPYYVDGVSYCGRCHQYLDSK